MRKYERCSAQGDEMCSPMQVDWYGYATLFVDAHGSAYCPEQPFTPCVTIATKFGKVSLSAVTPVLR